MLAPSVLPVIRSDAITPATATAAVPVDEDDISSVWQSATI